MEMIIDSEINHNKGKIVYRERIAKTGVKRKAGVHLYRHKGMYLGTPIDRIRMILCYQIEGKEWRWEHKSISVPKGRGTVTNAKASAFDIELIDEVIEVLSNSRVEIFGDVQKPGEAAPETKRDMNKLLGELGL